mgnify:CR=1 FL=1
MLLTNLVVKIECNAGAHWALTMDKGIGLDPHAAVRECPFLSAPERGDKRNVNTQSHIFVIVDKLFF